MEITGIQQVPASRDAVWNALNDPAILRQCLPGCESVERTSDSEFKVLVAAAIGPLRARFNGTLRIMEAHPPESCVMVFEGQGGAVGFGKGSSSVTLRETPEGTELSYSARAQVGGKLAQVGSRLIDSVARKMTDDFFKAFHAQLAPAPAPAAVAEPAAEAPPAGPQPQAASVLPAEVHSPAVPAPGARPANATALGSTPTPGVVMVPGWWLFVAAVLGATLSLAGFFLAR